MRQSRAEQEEPTTVLPLGLGTAVSLHTHTCKCMHARTHAPKGNQNYFCCTVSIDIY